MKARKLGQQRTAAKQRLKSDIKHAKVVVPEVAPHEREAASFWYRRIATSLLIGNGAGVLAVGGFLGKAEALAVVAPLVYPALAKFLTGVAFGFGSLFISLFWTSGRIDTYVEFYTKMETIGRKIVDPKLAGGKAWINIILPLLLFAQIGFLMASGWYFYTGSTQVVLTVGRVACQVAPTSPFCDERPSFLFSDPRPLPLQAGAQPVRENLTTTPLFVEHERQGRPSFSTLERLSVRGSSPISATMSSYTFRLNAADSVHRKRSCVITIADWFDSSSPPYKRSPLTDRFIAKAKSMTARYQVEPLTFTINLEHGSSSSQVLKWDVADAQLFPMKMDMIESYDVVGIPGDYDGGLLVYATSTFPGGPACLELAGQAGFEISRLN